MSRQLSFDLPGKADLGAADFFLSPANRVAFRQVTEDGQWPQGKLALIGPQGSGKSHLVRIWQAASGAVVLCAPTLTLADLPAPGRSVAVEDADTLPHAAEAALFHLHNHVLAGGGRLLMTARLAPADWPLALPDLASRVMATAIARIDQPDDALIAALLTKLFADRQLSPAPDLLPYLVARLERTFPAVQAVVAALDAAGLAERREIGRSLAREILERPGTAPDQRSSGCHTGTP